MNVTLGESLGYSVLGLAVVFLMLVLLMAVIAVMGRVMRERQPAGQASPAAPSPAPAPAAAKAPAPPAAGKVPAKGSLGEIDIYNVDERTAAILMAIVADKMDAPLNELRFISIKEIQ